MVLLSTLLAATQVPWLLALLHAVVDIFAGGRSMVKVLAFFAYLILLLGITTWHKQDSNYTTPKWLAVVLLSMLGLGLVLNLGTEIALRRSHNFSLSDYIILVDGQELTSTKLTHSHSLKGAIGLLVEKLGYTSFENLDVGLPLTHLVPTWLLILVLVIAITGCLLALLLFSRLISRHQGWRKWVFLFLYAIASFSLVKNIFDGGLLNYETLVAATILALLISTTWCWARWIAICLGIAFIPLQASLWFSGLYQSYGELQRIILHSAAFAGSSGVLLWAFLHKSWNRTIVLTGILALIVTGFSLSIELSMLSYRHISLTHKDTATVGSYKPITDTGFTEYARIGMLHLYKFQPSQTTSVGKLLDTYHLLDNFLPIAVPWKTCQPHAIPTQYNFTLTTTTPLAAHTVEIKDIEADTPKLLSSQTGKLTYGLTFRLGQCVPRQVNVIAESIRELGADKFIISHLVITP